MQIGAEVMSMQQELRRANTEFEPIHIACEELNFTWREPQLITFREMWAEGWDVRVIARRLGRKPEEVAILVMDQARTGKIKKRPTGIFGI